MKINIYRLEWTDKGLFGHLITDTGFDCVTLERNDKLIPVGTFKATIYHSPRLGYDVLLLHDVPGRSFVELHSADYENQLEGCVALASRRKGIENLSAEGFAEDANRATFDQFMDLCRKQDELYVTVR